MFNKIKYWFKRVLYLFKSDEAKIIEINKDYASYPDCNKKFYFDDYLDRVESDKKLKKIVIAVIISMLTLGFYKIWSNYKTKKKKKKNKENH
jgi:hypothetical protein